MKTLIVIAFWMLFIAIILLTSCAPQGRCYPSKKSRDYAVRQWMNQRSDGYWLVYTTRGFMPTNLTVFECRPDSIQLEKLKDGKQI